MSADFWAGYISGAVGIVIGNPLDVIKVRLQASSSCPKPSSTPAIPRARLPLTHNFTSVATLVAGTAAPVLGYGALNALLFVSYNRSEAWFTKVISGSSARREPDGGPTFQPGQNLLATWLAGAAGGVATWIVSTPTELIKCRAQMIAPPGSPSLSSWGVAKETVQKKGLRGLYFGGVVTVLRDSIGYGFYFWSYELLSRWFARGSNVSTEAGEQGLMGTEMGKVLFCGGIAGITTWASVFPLDVIKTRLQTQVLYPPSPTTAARQTTRLSGSKEGHGHAHNRHLREGAWEIAKHAYREDGLRPFFRGLAVCSIRAFIVNGVQWVVYEWIMRKLGQRR